MGKHTPRTDIVSVYLPRIDQTKDLFGHVSESASIMRSLRVSHTHMKMGGVCMMCACVNAVCPRWWRSFTPQIRATCTGCLSPACALAQAPAHSQSLAEGSGSWGGGAEVSFPLIPFVAEEQGLTEEGQGRGWCE